jgi:Undecaprenyl-phosphate glucose phosphotransferase
MHTHTCVEPFLNYVLMMSFRPKSPFPYLIKDALTFGFALFISLYFFKDAKLSKYEWVFLFCLVFLMFLFEFMRRPGHINQEFKKRFASHVKAYFAIITLVMLCYLFIPFPWHNKATVIGIITGISVIDFFINYMLLEMGGRKFIEEEGKNILIAGTGNTAKNVEAELAQQAMGYQLKGFINCNSNETCAVGIERVLGDLENINQYLYANNVDEIVIAMPSIYTKEIQNVLAVADFHGVRVKYILDYHDIFGKNYKITRYGHVDAVNIRQLPADDAYASFVKNCFDKVFSFFAILLLLPVFIAIAILIKLDSRGPVFYLPVRIGKGGKPFKIYKFRSMNENDAASGGTLSTQQNDVRITRVGRFLRKYSLDELPQFINVFIGTMSVVGPRPHRRFLNRQLQESVYKYMIRHYVKPGITGWAQVNGWRGPTDTEEQRKQRTLHDLWYIENWTPKLDLKIIFLTIFSKKAHKSAF